MKKNEILSLYTSLNSLLFSYDEDDESNGTSDFILSIQKELDRVTELVRPLEESSILPCQSALHELKNFFGQNSNQGVGDLINFCQNCLVYFAQILKNHERSKTKKYNKLIRSQSKDNRSSPHKFGSSKDPTDSKENVSNFSNCTNTAAKPSGADKERLRRQKSASKDLKTIKKTKTTGAFLLRNACKK